jgi:prepilin-type N-terminal cleavage/methylation domain-containing protein
MQNKMLQGFTIIELLIVIAIIGILVSIAVPTYKQYVEKARFAEVVMATAPYKTAVSIALQEGSALSDINAGQNGVPPSPNPTKHLASLTVESGVITSTATDIAGGYTYILTPDNEGSQWTVGGTCLKSGFCKG